MANKLIVEFGADTSSLRGELAALGGTVQQSMDQTTGTIGGVFDKLADRFTSFRHISTAIAVGLGLNFESIAKGAARMVLDFSQEEEDSLKNVVKLSQETADIYDKMFEKSRSSAENLAHDEEDINRLQKERLNILDGIASRQKELEGFVVESYDDWAALAELQKSAAEKDVERNRLAEIAKSLAEESLKTQEDSKAVGEEDIKNAKQSADIKEKSQKTEQEYQDLISKDVKENQEYLLLQQKAQYGLTDSEAQKLALLKLEFKEKQNISEIDDLLGKKIDGTITPAEQTHLQTLIMQEGVLQQQIADKEALIGNTKDQKTSEAAVTAEMKNQEAIQQSLLNLKKQGESPGGDLGVLNLVGGLRTYNDPADQAAYEASLVRSTTEQIDSEIKQYQDDIDRLNASGSSYASSQIPILKSYIDALDSREKNVRDYLFSPTYSDALGQGIVGEQMAKAGTAPTSEALTTKVVDSLTSINQRLSAAGFTTGGAVG